MTHDYLSTACLHGEHAYCASRLGHNEVGERWGKRPAQCKFCHARCVCPCHQPDGEVRRVADL